MKKSALFTVVLIFLLTSCAHLSSFLENDPYLSSFGEDGDFVFSQSVEINDFEKFNVVFTRLSGGYDPLSGDFYGALEGSFSRQKIKLALNASPSFEKTGKGVWTSDEYSIQITVPANGIILFSSSDVMKFYNETFANRKTLISPDISYLLVNCDFGMYVKNPKVLPDIGYDLSNEAIESFDYILTTANDSLADFEFSMKSDSFAESLLKLLKTAIVSDYRRKGLKVDTNYLNTIIFKEENVVFLKNQEQLNLIPIDFINTFTEVM